MFLVAVASTVAAIAAVGAGPAGAYLYWSAGGVARADLDGGGVNASFILDPYRSGPFWGGSVRGLALDDEYVYFGGADGVVGRAKLSGGDVDPDLFTIPQPGPESLYSGHEVDASALASGGGFVYWSSGEAMDSTGQPTDAIGRADANGTDVTPAFIATGAPVFALAVAAGHMYWVSEGGIGRANLNGTAVEPGFIRQPKGSVHGLAVGDGHIYWGSEHGVARSDLTGHQIDLGFITGVAHVFDVAVAGGRIYWCAEKYVEENVLKAEQPWIGFAELNGKDIERTVIKATVKIHLRLAANDLGPGRLRPMARHRRRQGATR